MRRVRRLLAALVAVLLGAGLLLGGPPTAALAATKPVVSSVGPGSGPLKPTVITIKGTNLKGAKAVRFGKKSGRIVKVVDASTLQVRTPKGVKAGKVSVTVKTRAGWSRKTSTATYTFVKAPKLSKLSATTGTFAGGQRLTLSGKNLRATSRVLFADVPAKIVSRSSKTVVITTPVGVVGKVAVKVVSPGGASKTKTFTYTPAPSRATSSLKPAAGSAAPTEVEWVTGGTDDDGAVAPWVVGLPAGATVPAIGAQFVVRPGSRAFPSGLAGQVSDVAVQADDRVRVTVAPTGLAQAVDRLSFAYSGRVRFPAEGQTNGRRTTTAGASYGIKGPTALFCTQPNGQSASFGADLAISVRDVDVDQHVDLGGLVSRPTYEGAVSAEIETTGKITVGAAATCKLKPEWQNAQRRVIPLGTTGATLSFAPSLEFKVSAKGTYTITDRTRTTFSVRAEYDKTPTFARSSRNLESTHGGALSFTVDLTAGASVQLALLDRAGLQGKLGLGVTAGVTATGTNVCVDGKLYGRASIGVFLDVWIARWEHEAFSANLEIGKVHGCVRADTPTSSGDPAITSSRLADATIGEPYSTRLATADDRPGRWALLGALPAGLGLDADDGSVTGTPSGPVSDTSVVVRFTDGAGRSATTTVRVRVLPTTGLGGGNLQITLKWAGGADLDLHVVDPAQEEIWYDHRESASGGVLDHDANANCRDTGDGDSPVENVYWPPNGAPSGTYVAAVRVYKECGSPLDWHLVVRRNGVVVLDETGSGDSPGYTFGLGQPGARTGRTTTVTTSTATK